jgi:hypothetical protein
MSGDSLHGLIDLVSRQAKDEDGNSPELVKVFISFHLFGLFGTLIILVTVLCSRSIQRHATWFSFAISWIISTVSYSLLFWGGSLAKKKPPYTLCLIQGIMIYAAPPLTAGTTLALVTQIWFLVRSVVTATKSTTGRIPPIILTALLIIPYLLYITFLVSTLVIGWQNPQIVRRAGSGMYCSFSNRMPGRISTLLVALILIPAAVLEILVCRAIRRQWSVFKQQPDALSTTLRVVAFTFVGILAIVLSIVFFFIIHHGADLNIIISIVPVTAVLMFGTQADLLRVWMFWKKRPMPLVPTEKVVELGTPNPPNKPVVLDIHP